MTLPYSYVKRFTAGAVFGLYMAYLLYFLNPQLDTDVPRVLLAAITYSLIAGLTFGTLLWLLRLARVRLFGRPATENVRQYGFGNVAAAVAISAAFYWLHLVLFSIYLPRGAVRVLSKATIVIAATAFIIFMLWFFERTASRRLSRLLFTSGVLVIAASAVLLYQRRDGYRDTSREVVLAEAPPVAAQTPIVVVALRSVPYDWLLTAIGEGLVPNIAALHEGGFATRIEPFRTASPKSLWASLATGQLPNRHGVTGRYSYRTALSRDGERFTLLPNGVGFRAWGLIPPVQRVAPRLPTGDSIPFWDCFGKMQLGASVVNWPGTAGGDGSVRHLVSDLVIRGRVRDDARVSALVERHARDAAPPQALARLERLREGQRRRTADAFGRDVRAARVLIELQQIDRVQLAVVSLNSLDETLDAIGAKQNALAPKGTAAGDAIRANLILFDRLIGELRETSRDALFVVVSASAPVPPPVPVSVVSIVNTLQDIADPGENNGFVIMSGAGFVHRANPEAVELVDFAPTLLFTAALPLARDFDGAVIGDAFDDALLRRRTVTYIGSYKPARFVVTR